MAGSVDLVGNGGKIIAAGGKSFTIDDHRLAALAEIGECLAEFLQVGQTAGGVVGLEVDVFDTRVFGSLVDGIDSIQEANAGDRRSVLKGRNRAERIVFPGLLRESEGGHIHYQDPFFRQDWS